MTVSATGANNYNMYALYNELYGGNANASGTGSPTAATAKTATYGGNSSGLLNPQGRQELEKALAGMREAGYATITFEEIEKYRKGLETDFAETIKMDLAELGVDPEIEFRLVVDSYGKVQVVTDHADKVVIEKYLADNPDKVEEFKHIQALSNLKRSTQKALTQQPEFARNLKLSLQAEAIQAFFATTDNDGADYFSQIANFGSDGTTSYLLGLNQSV